MEIEGKENEEVLTTIHKNPFLNYDPIGRSLSIKNRIDSETVGKKISTKIFCYKMGENINLQV